MRYSVHTTEIHLDRCNDEKIFSVIKFMQNTPDTNSMNKKIKFLAKGAKFHVQAQKTSKVDFISRFFMTFEASKNIACAASVSRVIIEKVFFRSHSNFHTKT